MDNLTNSIVYLLKREVYDVNNKIETSYLITSICDAHLYPPFSLHFLNSSKKYFGTSTTYMDEPEQVRYFCWSLVVTVRGRTDTNCRSTSIEMERRVVQTVVKS